MKIEIEYCVVWDYTDKAVGLTEKLLEDKRQAIDELVLIPSGGGRFEVRVDGRQIWSKKETKRFPEYGEIVEALPE